MNSKVQDRTDASAIHRLSAVPGQYRLLSSSREGFEKMAYLPHKKNWLSFLLQLGKLVLVQGVDHFHGIVGKGSSV